MNPRILLGGKSVHFRIHGVHRQDWDLSLGESAGMNTNVHTISGLCSMNMLVLALMMMSVSRL